MLSIARRFVLGSGLILAFVGASSAFAASSEPSAAPRFFESAQGEMNLQELARIVQERAAICAHDGKPLPVVIQKVRWPRNPVDYARYVYTWGVATYVTSMTIGTAKVQCALLLDTRSKKAYFEGCRGDIPMPPMGAFAFSEFILGHQTQAHEGEFGPQPSFRDPFDEMF